MKIVVKFGGSSLASAEQFKKVGAIIKENKDRRYVVPSAPGKRNSGDTKVTDLLYSCYALAENNQDFSDALATIKRRYDEIIQGLDLTLSLDAEFETIKENFEKKAGKMYAASRGEYLNGKIMAAYIGFPFVDAAEVVRFDENDDFCPAETQDIMSEKLADMPTAVIPGFYGARADGTIVTFSRGGSDVSGSVVARAVHADLYENWTDVSGCLATDPRIVDNPEVVETITYKELRELSYMGASVLQADSVFPVRREGIPINIRNTNRPQDPGTMIVESTCKRPGHIITGIAGKKGFAAITVEKDMMNAEVGFCRKVLQVLEDNGLSLEHMPSGVDTMTMFVNQEDFVKSEQRVISGIHRAVNPDLIELESRLALIAVVGRGMKDTHGVASRVFGTLAAKRINVKMIDQGSSELNIIIGVKEKYFEEAIRALYDEFIAKKDN